MKRYFIILVACLVAGCTTTSDRAVIEGYRKAEAQKQLALDNTTKMVKDQMLLNSAQRIRAIVKDPQEAERCVAVLQLVWMARNEVEVTREQYTFGRILTMVTVGSYLYDKQGAFNVIMESLGEDMKRVSGATNAANSAAGVKSPRDIINPPPATQALKKIESQVDRFNSAMDQVK